MVTPTVLVLARLASPYGVAVTLLPRRLTPGGALRLSSSVSLCSGVDSRPLDCPTGVAVLLLSVAFHAWRGPASLPLYVILQPFLARSRFLVP